MASRIKFNFFTFMCRAANYGLDSDSETEEYSLYDPELDDELDEGLDTEKGGSVITSMLLARPAAKYMLSPEVTP